MIRILVLVLIAFQPCGIFAAEPIVILAMGQSNMARKGALFKHVEFKENPDPRVKILNSETGSFETWDIRKPSLNSELGNEQGAPVIPYYFARRLAEETGREIKVVASARGGRPISYWNVGSKGWETLLTQTAEVPGVDVILWQQGESDSNGVGKGLTGRERGLVRGQARAKYFKDFGELTLRVKKSLGKVVWITGEARPQHGDIPNSVFHEFEKKAPSMFAVANCSKREQVDTEHYSDESIAQIGYHDYWLAWTKLQKSKSK